MRFLLPLSLAAFSLTCEAVLVAAFAILSFLPKIIHSSSSVSTIVPLNESPSIADLIREYSLPSKIHSVKLATVASATPIGSTTPEGPACVCFAGPTISCNFS